MAEGQEDGAMSTVTGSGAVQYVYDFAALDRVPEGPTSAGVAPRRLLSGDTLETAKSSTIGAALFGEHIIFARVGQARGSGSKAHTHPNEQFNLIVQGTMLADIAGDRIFARAGCLQHTPTNAVHTGVACPDEDLTFLAIKDMRHGVTGPPVDGRHDGPLYLPGFGKRAGERRLSTAETMAASERTHPPAAVQYVYPLALLDRAVTGRASALVEPRAPLALGGGATAAFVSGERLHVGFVALPAGAAVPLHRHGSEKFVYVLRGALEVEMDDVLHQVPCGCALHVPGGVAHRIAGAGGVDAEYVAVTNKAYGIETVRL
jgi:quercetin dioxygenase-like cupin family protein